MKKLIKRLQKAFAIYVVRCSCFFGFHKWVQYGEKPMITMKNSKMYYDRCTKCGCENDYFIMW